MINIESGEIVLENLSYSLNPNLKRKKFEETFPKQYVRNINDMRNGYIWFNIWGSIIETDNILLLSVCFSHEDEIESISIYPQISQNIKLD